MDVRELGQTLSNWGRWGTGDERGTTNLITPEALVAAAQLVRQGKVFDLGINFDSSGPQPGGVRNNPIHLMSATGVGQSFRGGFCYADDYVIMPLQCATQWDGLAHVFYDGQLYNGFPATDVTPKGAAHVGIEKQAKGITGRGVLLDIAALKDLKWLEPGYAITPADLDAAAEREGVTIRSGDIVLFRTGWRRFFLETGSASEYMKSEPGLGLACCEWLHRHEVAAVCSDNFGIEVQPPESADDSLPVHMVLIRDMGMTLGEIFDLEELAADCEADGVWEFLFSAPVLKVTGGVGSPINPLALK